MQHRDAIRQRQHAIDVVLDQQHGMRRGELADQRADHLAIGFRQTREGFVQQQQLRVSGQRDGDLQQPLLAVRQIGAGFGRAILQPDRGQQRPGAGVDRLERVGIAPQAVLVRAAGLHRDAHVLERRQVAEHAEDLERTAEPEADATVHRQMRDVVAIEHDPTGIRAEQSGQHVEQRGFAGAVRADQAVQPVGMHIELDIRRHDQRAESLVQTAHRQDRLVRRACRVARRRGTARSAPGAAECRNAPGSSAARVAAGAAPRPGSLQATAGRTG